MVGANQPKKSKTNGNQCNFNEMPSLKKSQKATSQNSTQSSNNQKNDKAKNSKQPTTRIVVKCNCGFPNNLFLRGEGIDGLSWQRGVQLKNTKPDEWIWETSEQFKKGKIKVMLNDRVYEQ